jgi:hypothetical protein
MAKMRGFGCIAAVALALYSAATPAAADGLSRFREAIKQAPPGSLTYKNARSLGESGFVIEDVVLTPPPDATPGPQPVPVAIKRVTVEDFDFAAVDANLPPKFAKMRIDGMAISAKPAAGVDLQQLAGIDMVTADFRLDYRLDPERKTLSLDRLELDLAGLARLEFSMVLDGVSVDQVGRPGEAMNEASLRTATLVFEDRSLLGKVLPAAAKLQGSEADALVKMGTAMLNGMRLGQGPEVLAAMDAVTSYMQDYRQPKGSLKITLNPPAKTPAAALADIKSPDEAVKALGLVVSYAGTRPGPPPVAAPASAPATAPGAAGCTPGARFFVLHEDAYWSVTVRDATKAGDKCVARIDRADDDVVFAPGDTLAWSLDGPGKPAGECTDGAKVLVAYSDGGWYPARVTGKPEGAKCPIKYDVDGEEEAVEVKKLRRLE